MKKIHRMKTRFLLVVAFSLLLLACSEIKGPAAEIGDTVTISYESHYINGSIFDRSADYSVPVTFTIGKKEVFPGIEQSVMGMHQGEEKNIMLTPEAAYGPHDSDKVEQISLDELSAGSHLRIGTTISATDKVTGKEVSGRIINISQRGVIIDFNHPLAGQPLLMDIIVKNIMKK